MVEALSQDRGVMAAIGQATAEWSSQGASHHSINKEVRDEHGKKVLVHMDSHGQYSAQRVKNFHAAEKAARKGDEAIDRLLAQAQAHPGEALHSSFKVKGQRYMATLHADGRYDVQKVSDYKEAKALSDAVDQLAARMKATPPSQRTALSMEVRVSKHDKWQVTLDIDGTVHQKQTEKPHHGGGFFGGLFKALGSILPIVSVAALVFPPLLPVAAGLSAVNGVQKLANGDLLGGIASLAGAAGGLGGGPFAGQIGTAAKGLQSTMTALGNGDILGAIGGAAGVAGGFGRGDFARVAETVQKDAAAAGAAMRALGSGDLVTAARGVAQATGTIGGREVLATTGAVVHAADDVAAIRRAFQGGQGGLIQIGSSLAGAYDAGRDLAKRVGL